MQIGVQIEGHRHIRERADGDQRDFSGMLAHRGADELRGRLADGLSFRLRELGASQSVFTVHISGGNQAARQRGLCACGHGNVGAARDFHHAQGVWKRQLQWHVARDRRDSLNL